MRFFRACSPSFREPTINSLFLRIHIKNSESLKVSKIDVFNDDDDDDDHHHHT